MQTESSNLTAKESFDIITQMISEARGKVQRNNFFFLFWGWIVVIGNIGMYTLSQTGYSHPYAIWAITVPAWIFTLYKTFNRENPIGARNHLDRISIWLWISFGLSIFILVAFGYKLNFQINPLILIVAAIPTFVSGTMLKFKPLLLGGISFWIFGIIGFLVPVETQPLIGAAAIVCGYLIPGYLLKKR